MKGGKIVCFAALAIALALGFLFFPLRQWFIRFEDLVQSLGPMGPAVVALAYVVCTVLFVPGSAITVAAATLFGPKTGFFVVLIGANLGALCAFLFARTFLRERIARWAEANPKFSSLDRAIGDQGFKMVLLARLSPALPFNVLNYLLGVSRVTTGAYIVATLIGMLPGMLLYIYVGAAARDAFSYGNGAAFDLFQQGVKYIGLIATLALVFIMTRIARKALRHAEEESVGPLPSLPRDGRDVRGRTI